MENIAEETANTENVFEKYKRSRWIKVIVGVITMFCIGFCYAWTVFNAPIATEMDWTVTELAVAFTIFMYAYSVFGILSGFIIKKRKGKVWQNLVIAAILIFASFLVSSRAHNLITLYIGFGVLGGAAVVFAYNSIITVVTRWFQELLGVVTGLLLMGYGLGSFVMGKAYSWVISVGADWRVVFLVFGIFLAVLLVGVSFVLTPPPQGYHCPAVRKPKVDKHPITPVDCSPLQMIRRPSFWLLFCMGTFLTMASMGITSNARYLILAVKAEASLSEIATLVGLISIFNACGRIFTGFLNDWGGLRFNICISATCVVLTTAFIGLAVFCGNYIMLVISFVLFGFAAGMSVPDGAVVTQKFYGEKNYQLNVQIVLFCGLFNSLGAMVVSGIYVAVGNFYVPVFVLAGIALIGWAAAMLLRKP